MKCKFCKRENNADVIPKHGRPLTKDDARKFVPIIGFETRGLDIVEYSPRVFLALLLSLDHRGRVALLAEPTVERNLK